MAQTLFTDLVTLIQSSWLNDVDAATYSGLSAIAGTNTITATGPTTVSAYAANQRFYFTPANTNTGATTLNISSIGAKNIFLRGAALVGGELFKSQPVAVIYDGTQFHIIGNSATPSVPRGHIGGLVMSTAGASATMSVAVGQAADSTGQVLMTLASSINKTTGAWAVGSGNGGKLSAAALAAGTYHFYEIMRTDTGVVDVGFDTSATSPTLPTGYTYFRRIASAKNDGTNWIRFIQNGDDFYWSTPPALDFNAAGSSAGALVTVTVPTGVKVKAYLRVGATAAASGNAAVAITDPALSIVTPSNALTTPLADVAFGGAANSIPTGAVQAWTNTSAQVNHAEQNTNTVSIQTIGWLDRRGRDD